MKNKQTTTHSKSGRFFPVFFVLCVLLIIVSTSSLCVGSSNVSFGELVDLILGKELSQQSKLILLELRFPRLAISLITGASLGLAGAGMQSIFRNPLADPSITGVSSGAALGAVLAISFGLGYTSMQFTALIGGLLAFASACIIGRSSGKLNPLSMLLGGIAINAFCGAIVGWCMYNAREGGLKSFVFWSLGSLDNADWNAVTMCIAISIPFWILTLLLGKSLNLIALGEETAFHSGVNVRLVWYLTAVSSAVITASCVAVCGIIGFVGLVVPHITRLLCGADNRKLLPTSAVAGALLLTFSDLLSRLFNVDNPVPIGVITALAGVPFFLFLLKFGKGERNA